MRKLFFIILLGGFFLPFIVFADGVYTILDTNTGTTHKVYYSGLIPCGKCDDVSPNAPASMDGECNQPVAIGTPVPRKFVHCSICHLFVMFTEISKFILLKIVPPIGTIMLIFGGIALYQAGASPEKFNKARSILLSAIIGLVIIYTSWIIVNAVLQAVGIADWVGFGEGWFQISCGISTKW